MSIFADFQSFIPERLEHFLYKYGEIAKVYVAAYDGKGDLLADFACNERERKKISRVFHKEDKEYLFKRVTEYNLEDQVVEETAFDGIQIAASAIKQKGRTQMVWMFLAQIAEENPGQDKKEENPDAADEQEGITLERQTTLPLFFWAIDVLRDMGAECIQAQYSVAEWEAANRQSQHSANEMTGSMRRMEIIMEILQKLDSDKPVEYVMQEFLRLTATYLRANVANIIQTDAGQIRFVAQWGEDNKELNNRIRSGEWELPAGKKPLILSCDSEKLTKLKGKNGERLVGAIAMMPVELVGQMKVCVCYYDTRRERNWKLEEIQFMQDTIQILQSIMEKRLQQTSIDSSCASLEEILETIGCAVIVFDPDTHEVQFMNQKTNLMFPKGKMDTKFLENVRQILHRDKSYEFCDRKRETWYEAHRDEVRWVDGKNRTMYSIFDITDKKHYQQKIEQQAYTDFLTGLFNRLCCERDLARTVDEAGKEGKKEHSCIWIWMILSISMTDWDTATGISY